jgi:regulator of protease activity HflC (stomatin/prohibitin superfamily)
VVEDITSQERRIRVIIFLVLLATGGWYLWRYYWQYWSALGSGDQLTGILSAVLVIPLAVAVATSVHLLAQWERGVTFFLGRHIEWGRKRHRWFVFPYPFSLYKGFLPTPFFFTSNRGPGFVFTIPLLETMIRVDTRDDKTPFKAAETQTKDQAPVNAEGLGIWSFDPDEPHLSVIIGRDTKGLIDGAINLAAKAALGKFDLDTAISDKEAIAQYMKSSIETLTQRWGVLMHELGLSDVVVALPGVRAKIAAALEAKYAAGELLAAAKIERQAAEENLEAARIYAANPMAWKVRTLQAWERGVEKAKAVIMPSEALSGMGSVMAMQQALETEPGEESQQRE